MIFFFALVTCIQYTGFSFLSGRDDVIPTMLTTAHIPLTVKPRFYTEIQRATVYVGITIVERLPSAFDVVLALCLDFESSVAALLHTIGSYRHSRNGIQVAKELGGDAYKILVRKPKVVLFYCFVLYFIKLKMQCIPM